MVRSVIVVGLAFLMQACVSADEFERFKQSVDTRFNELTGDPTPSPKSPAEPIDGCYTVYKIESGNPHTEKGESFCVVSEATITSLYPTNMPQWGTDAIELTYTGNSNTYRFDVDIVNHPPESKHVSLHSRVFQIVFTPKKATIQATGKPTPAVEDEEMPTHGGVAHSIQ